MVKRDGKCGFIDNEGKVVIPLKYDDASSFSEKLASVKTNGKYGYINEKNKIIISPQYDNAQSFINGLAIISMGKKWGVINKLNKEIITSKFDYILYFDGKTGRVHHNGKIFYINKKGECVKDCP